MTLATVSEASGPRRVRMRRFGRISVGLDALLLVFSLAICVALFGSGGAEALIGAIAGALSGRRQASRNVVSSAFAGWFAGALFAGFFHGTLAALF